MTKLLFASCATALIVAESLPSGEIDMTLLETVTDVTAAVVVPVPPLPTSVLEPSPPPQAASNNALNQLRTDNLRIMNPRSTRRMQRMSLNKDWSLHAESSA
jgi:hypothetical protein